MNIVITGRQVEITEAIRSSVEEKIGRLERYLHENTEIKVNVRARKSRQTIEVTIFPLSGPIMRAEDSQDNLYTAIDVVYDKLHRQLRKYKTKLQNRSQHNRSIRFENIEEPVVETKEPNEMTIERRKKFDMKPMNTEEAVLQMELLGHDFYVFRNIDTDDVDIVYRRKQSGYGLIQHV